MMKVDLWKKSNVIRITNLFTSEFNDTSNLMFQEAQGLNEA